jgi:HPt (histidine-containing phosphotransfer) domain-containing protein
LPTPSRKPSAAVTTFGDHEVITPENKLRDLVSERPLAPDEPDPVERAEQALAELSSEFGQWMDAECDRLDQARRTLAKTGFTAASKDALFHAAHDIKGEAATFGYPAVTGAADSLCRLIEFTPDPNRIPMAVVDQHVDAVRAIYREYARSDAEELAGQLTRRLREVTDDFLVRENHDRPEVIEQILGNPGSPPIAPE